MTLVGYSDSEDSDAEDTTNNPPVKSSEPVSSKPAFQKVVDGANSHKIRVILPKTSIDGLDDLSAQAPPSKRARTGGAFSGFNSLLPAPKNANKIADGRTAPSSGGRLSRGRGPGVGVNLKTGASPAFSREPQPTSEIHAAENDSNVEFQTEADSTRFDPTSELSSTSQEVKLIGKPTMFKPLSVGRKPIKRKPPKQASEASTSMPKKQATEMAAASVVLSSAPEQTSKPKKSLFSTFEDDSRIAIATPTNGSLHTLDDTSDAHVVQDGKLELDLLQSTAKSENDPPSAQTLSSLATSLDLTPAQRRQLFGRNAKDLSQLMDTHVSHFSLAAEYSNNNALRESESTAPGHNPVRSIAPGKHSLQKLVNMATNQKESLEESFATGKANKKSAGSKYGW